MTRNFRLSISISLVLSLMVFSTLPVHAVAPRPGSTCNTLGQKIVSGKFTYTCSKSGSKLIWSEGSRLPLRLVTKSLPAAASGIAYQATIDVIGGTGYHFCDLERKSSLPLGFSLNRKTCTISGVGEILSVGTSKKISPPFMIVITDSSAPKPASVRYSFTITTYPPRLAIKVNTTVSHCKLNFECDLLVATAIGGTPPYSFRKGTGTTPIGLTVVTVGDSAYLRGIAGSSGSYGFKLCARDRVESDVCKEVSVTVDKVPTHTVIVNKFGNGTGLVTSSTSGISCGSRCIADFIADSRLTFTAYADFDSVFEGWSGDCAGTGSCTLDMNSDKVVAATFVRGATGTYRGTALVGHIGPVKTGCDLGSIDLVLGIAESAGGEIIGSGYYGFLGTRVGNKIEVNVTTQFGPRGPYVWQWNGTNLSGTLPSFCWYTDLYTVLLEGSFTFNLQRIK